jgi:hypothetical protein
MKRISCQYNIDTACVEIKYDNGAVVSIDCVSIEDEYARNMLERSELDWLLCNKPLEYVQLVLSGGLEKYLQGPYEHRLSD